MRKLNKISLYTRAEFKNESKTPEERIPVKEAHFDYTYELCPGVDNNTQNTGKLTLSKMWFTHGKNQRGRLNPYVFHYQDGDRYDNGNKIAASGEDHNPGYSQHNFDRWGNYKPGTGPENLDFPYTDQDNKANLDYNVAAWSLKQIELPSGGLVKVHYESDDYGYVQNKTAMQMTDVVAMGTNNPNEVDPQTHVFNPNVSPDQLEKDSNLRVYFRLENPVEIDFTGLTDDQKNDLVRDAGQRVVDRYIDFKSQQFQSNGHLSSPQLYFKTKINLEKMGENPPLWEWIAGYANVDISTPEARGILREAANGPFTIGYITLMPIARKQIDYHPFAAAAYQHLQTQQADLAYRHIYDTRYAPKNMEDLANIEQHIVNMAKFIAQVPKMFENYYEGCWDRGWARQVDLDKTWIRLNSADKVKYGGGLRVKKLELCDNWSAMTQGEEDESIYGQTYRYETEELQKDPVTNQHEMVTISSGVATYEPVIGGDETALRMARKFRKHLALKANRNLYAELPVNESLFPGPHVGYSKVTVKSLVSAKRAGENVAGIPEGFYATTGATVSEYYTAKDFPTIVDETAIDRYERKPKFNIVSYKRKMTRSQGYSIMLNDMHGKPKRVDNYPQDNQGNILYDAPTSWVKYEYQTEPVRVNGEEALKLNNTVSIVNPDGSTEEKIIGQEIEMVLDLREHTDQTKTFGGNFNTDWVLPTPYPPIPIVIPSYSKNTNIAKTAVMNKIIHRSGILVRTVASDGGFCSENYQSCLGPAYRRAFIGYRNQQF